MQLNELISLLSVSSEPLLPSIEITSVTERSGNAKENSIFVCIKGLRSDGHRYAENAYQRGCRVFVAEKPLALPEDATVIPVEDTREALALLSCRIYGDPSRKMRVIGITGTKGKTTVACLLRQILEGSGIRCGYIGTNGIAYGDRTFSTNNTTPDAPTLQKTLLEMEQFGCQAVVMEVSSQAILQKRILGTVFDACLFTNLSPDHIGEGEHRDFEDYAACKHRLFTDFSANTVIYNADDPYALQMISGTTADRTVSCSTESESDYRACALMPLRHGGALGMQFEATSRSEKADVRLPMIGKCNASNALLALAVAGELFRLPLQKSANLLESARISGRSEVLGLPNGALAVIDYAHNGISLRQLLSNLWELSPKRLITLFGSVGERTQLRRIELGTVAAELSSLCILTSDNPGKEDPSAIISDIEKAFVGTDTPYVAIPDRREAILYALQEARSGDILVLAGKGHEQYQLVGTEKLPFSEREIIESAIYASK